jgi:hypothetical protein
MKIKVAFVASALALAPFGAVFAQNVNANNLVNVNISNVANNLAKDLSVNVSQIPVTVQAPIGVAATVCGVQANVLAQQNKDGSAECQAQTTSTALNQIVQRNLTQQ